MCVGLLGTGCGLDSNFADLGEKLLDPDAQGIDAEPEQLLTGPHFALGVDTSDADGPIALAISDEGQLSIVHLADRSACVVGPSLRYGRSIGSPGRRALIPTWVPDAEAGAELRFTDFDCNLQPSAEPAASLPLALLSDFGSQRENVVLVKRGSSLVVLNPWTSYRETIAEGVRDVDPIAVPGGFAWVEAGQLVTADPSLGEIQRVGSDVRTFTMHRSLGELAWLEAREEAGETSFQLRAAPLANPTQVEEVAEKVCSPRYVETADGPQLSYLSPCAEGRLMLHPRSPRSEPVEIARDVAAGPRTAVTQSGTWLTYLTSGEDASEADQLWLKKDAGEAVALGASATLSFGRQSAAGGWLALVEYSAQAGGELIEWKGGTLQTIAEGVVELGTLRRIGGDETFLGNFDGVVGDVFRLDADGNTSLIAQGVPRNARVGQGFLDSFDGVTGRLQLIDEGSGSLQEITTGVPLGSFRELQQVTGVMALAQHDTETGTNTLEVHFTGLGLSYPVHDGVTEGREVAFPRRGLMYNVVHGPDAGLWFVGVL